MFEALSERFNDVFHRMRGRGKITEDNVREVLRMVRTALLEADVHVEVARSFCDECLEKALGAQVINTLHPDQVMVKVVHDELVALMGPVDPRIPYVAPGPTVLMLAGLQGSGKTTTCAKLAQMTMKSGKRPLLVAADLKRPAAIDQLEVLGGQLDIPVHAERDHANAVKVCRNSIVAARKLDRDLVILDTAGRLAIDEELMREVAQIAQTTTPHQIYLVLDSMTGQDAVNTAKRFNERLELDGLILTKFDSDTRGGAALSAKRVTGKPIKFIGTGEKIENIEAFHPDRMASRILGMGDVVSLVERAQEQYDEEEAVRLEKRMKTGLTLEDFLGQLKKMKRMGSMRELMKLVPGMGSEMKNLDVDDDEITHVEAMIHSMTRQERADPSIIDAGRRRRIARGSGTDVKDVSGLVKNFAQMREMMRAMSGMSMMDRMKFGTQFSKAAATGMMPQMKIKKKSKQLRRLSQKDKRKRRKRK